MYEILDKTHLDHSHWVKIHSSNNIPFRFRQDFEGNIHCQNLVNALRVVIDDFPRPDSCFVYYIKEKFNLTLTEEDSSNLNPVIDIIATIKLLSLKSNGQTQTVGFKGRKVEIVPLGIIARSIRFATIMKPQNHRLALFLMPFDLQTWIFIVALLTYTVLIPQMFSKRISLVQLISFLLEQGTFIPRTQLALFWLFICLVLSNSYKGVLYSILTKPSHDDAPSTIEDVSISPYPIVTLQKVYFETIASNHKSMVRHAMSSFIKHAEKMVHLKLVYSRILEKLELADGFIPGLFWELYEKLDSNEMTAVNTIHDFRSTPIIILDYGLVVSIMTRLQEMYTSYLVIQGKEEVPQLSTRYQFEISRNFFLPLIKIFYQGLTVSGLYTRMQELQDIFVVGYNVKNIRRESYSRVFKPFKKQPILSYLFNTMGENVVKSGLKPLTIQFAFVLGQLVFIFVVVAIATFVCEIVF